MPFCFLTLGKLIFIRHSFTHIIGNEEWICLQISYYWWRNITLSFVFVAVDFLISLVVPFLVAKCNFFLFFTNLLGNFSGGTASYLLGMSARVASQADEGNTPINVKNLSLGWMIGFLFAVSFVGLFSIVPLRKV